MPSFHQGWLRPGSKAGRNQNTFGLLVIELNGFLCFLSCGLGEHEERN
jgi:hypothetical protein